VYELRKTTSFDSEDEIYRGYGRANFSDRYRFEVAYSRMTMTNINVWAKVGSGSNVIELSIHLQGNIL